MLGERTRPSVLAVLACALLQATAALTSQQPIFRSRADLVVVDVIATGADGKAVLGLRAVDFELFVDGRPTPIETVDLVRHETASADALITPLVASAAGATRASNDRALDARIIVIVFDDISLRFSAGHFNRAKAVVLSIVDRLGPGDQVAMVSTSRHSAYQIEFTTDGSRIREAFDRLILSEQNSNEMTPDVLRKVAEQLESAGPQRKTVVLIASPGILESAEYLRLFTATQRANVALYTFDPRYSNDMDEGIHAETVEARAEQVGGYRAGVSTLRALAENTGGLAAANTNLFDASVGRMFDDTSAYYQLGFVSTVPKDGMLHDIEVRARNKDIRIRARQGFVSEKAVEPGSGAVVASRLIDAVLAAPVQRHGLPMRLATVTIPTADGRRSVVNWVTEVRSGFSSGDQLEIKALALDMTPRVRGSDTYSAAMTGAGVDRWLRIAGSFVLPEGRYQLRVAASHVQADLAGSVFVEIDVPRRDGPMTVGGIAFASPALAGVSRAEKLHPLLIAAPVGRDAFAVGEAIDALVPISVTRAAGRVDVAWTVTDALGKSRSLPGTGVSATALLDGGVLRVSLPLAELDAGPYRLRATVRAAGRAVTREAVFRVGA